MKDGGNRILTLALLFVFCSLGAIGSSGQPPSADDSRIPRDAVLLLAQANPGTKTPPQRQQSAAPAGPASSAAEKQGRTQPGTTDSRTSLQIPLGPVPASPGTTSTGSRAGSSQTGTGGPAVTGPGAGPGQPLSVSSLRSRHCSFDGRFCWCLRVGRQVPEAARELVDRRPAEQHIPSFDYAIIRLEIERLMIGLNVPVVLDKGELWMRYTVLLIVAVFARCAASPNRPLSRLPTASV